MDLFLIDIKVITFRLLYAGGVITMYLMLNEWRLDPITCKDNPTWNVLKERYMSAVKLKCFLKDLATKLSKI